MNILRNLFGAVTSGIVRLAVTAGVLVLIYLFIVKPVLNTTNDAIKNSGLSEISKTVKDVEVKVRRRKRLIRCIERSRGNPRRIRRCAVKF